MIAVEPTERNWEIYSKLCELDAEYQARTDEESRSDIIALAQTLCQELEIPN